jgi:putative membrane-bound dehydrogenase-like protein
MKNAVTFIAALVCAIFPLPFLAAEAPPSPGKIKPLFDGKTLSGWEGDTNLWRVEAGALTGGSLTETVKRNDFLASTRDYTNFIVRFKIKLTGKEGFINSGFQIRSQRVPGSSEMAGYQCDYGDPNWWGAIYDESRRNKVMSPSDMAALGPVIRRSDWNEYVIRADGPRITTWLNGVQAADFIEPDTTIPNYDWGKLGIQVHGGGKALVQVKDISIEELRPTAPGKKFIGAPEPKPGAKASPLTPEEEQATFTLPPGFEIELVAQESEGIGKFVALDWDLQGRLWSMTALEYPVDANENPAAAQALYASKAKDKVVVFDRDLKSPTGYASKPRVFADGLAIPLGILPYKNGVYVQHGPDIVLLSDTDGDGKADKRDVILSGFGVQDSHLFPHQFTRAPGNWIWMAQGAFNYGKVRTKNGKEQQFDQTRMAKFRYDGSQFEITSQGPCNIWGLALTAEGEAWIQEANDYGYPTMPFHEYANYPGCSDAQWKSYAPEFPGTAPDFQMGGTGLSGLAITDRFQNDEFRMTNGARNANANSPLVVRHPSSRSWPEAYCDVHYIANPITRKIQAIKAYRDGARWKLQKLPDFVQSGDEWFRPVALRLGPDGCLYFVDWYNKIISHNEVPRNHPERDKKRGRIWRVKHRDVKPLNVPDFTKLSGDELLARLGGESTPRSHLAWQAITDRQMKELVPKLKNFVADKSQTPGKRIASLWALEGLGGVDARMLKPPLEDASRNVRREAARAAGEACIPPAEIFYDTAVIRDAEPEVRAEVIRAAGRFLANSSPAAASDESGGKRKHDAQNAVRVLINLADLSPMESPTAKSTHSGKMIKVADAYDREFERYLVRFFLEQQPNTLADFLKFDSQGRPRENTILATLAMEPRASATELARSLPLLQRPPGTDELLRLAQFPDEPGVGEALQRILQNAATRTAALESLMKVRTKLDGTKLTALFADVARELWKNNSDTRTLALRLIIAFRLSELEGTINDSLNGRDPDLTNEQTVLALRAQRELGANQLEGIVIHVTSSRPEIADEAVLALAGSRNKLAPAFILNKFWNGLSATQRRSALAGLTSNKAGAAAVVEAARSGLLPKDDLDSAMLDRLQTVLGADADLAALLQEMEKSLRPVLRLNGKDDAWVDSELTLDGPFTVETWVKLDAGIDNNDGILGAPGVLDMNFHDAKFRVWAGRDVNDAIIAKRKISPDVWMHVAVTRDGTGRLRIFQNGELDNDQSAPVKAKFEHLRIGWTSPAQGTAAWLSEFRVWNRARTAEEIRADFDRSFDGETKPAGLEHLFTGTTWKQLQPGAKVVKTSDFPLLLTAAESRAQETKFSKFRALAETPGDLAHGQSLFTAACMNCHSVGGKGGQIGPVLNGAGAMEMDTLLRAVLTPNAAMEAGYRTFRVELRDGDVLDGLLVSEDKDAIVLRRQNMEDTRVAQKDVRRAGFTRLSMMPEGQLEALKPQEVSDLFSYLKTLK